ncbi:MAG: hypothetical protein H7296_15950 [Bacteroidia bacterium]|nr:hypothetical protein [Bacteroidia bacterium]
MRLLINISYITFALFLLASEACDKIPARTANTPDAGDSLSSGYFICNEGNFQWGNATLSFFNIKKNVLYEDVYKTINKKPLGDILQSISIFNNTAYLVLNNSGKIEIMSPKTFEGRGTVTGFRSPRFFLGINENKAYVSDLYDNHIAIVDLQQNKIKNKIPCYGWTEEMLLFGSWVFVTNKYSRYLYIINAISDQLTDSVFVGYGSGSITRDAQNNLWILTSGNILLSIKPQLHRLNPLTLRIISSFNFATDAKPLKLITDPSGTHLYWINGQIYKMKVDALTLPVSPWVQTTNRNIYALGFDKIKNEILAADAKDFVQQSEILRYDSSGNLLGSYAAGINATYFLTK